MIGLNRFLKSNTILEKITILFCNASIFLTIYYGFQGYVLDYKYFDNIIFSVLVFSTILQLEMLVRFKAKKNTHINSFDYYVNNINPAKSNFFYYLNNRLLSLKNLNDINLMEIFLVSLILITFICFIGTVINYNLLTTLLLILLVVIANYAVFKILNSEKVVVDKLNLISKVTDLKDEDIENIKVEILYAIRIKGFVNKIDILDMYLDFTKKKETDYEKLFI